MSARRGSLSTPCRILAIRIPACGFNWDQSHRITASDTSWRGSMNFTSGLPSVNPRVSGAPSSSCCLAFFNCAAVQGEWQQ
jgi:hypothetical protein